MAGEVHAASTCTEGSLGRAPPWNRECSGAEPINPLINRSVNPQDLLEPATGYFGDSGLITDLGVNLYIEYISEP